MAASVVADGTFTPGRSLKFQVRYLLPLQPGLPGALHVTIRILGNVGGLRRRDTYLAVREATIVTARREDFRIVHASIQSHHIHLIVEADDKSALSKGVQGFSISAARQINKAITARGGDRRTGKVISDRFHARPLTSPRAARNTLSYVLNNWRHHHEDKIQPAQSWRVDPFSSGLSSSAGRSSRTRRSYGPCGLPITRCSSAGP